MVSIAAKTLPMAQYVDVSWVGFFLSEDIWDGTHPWLADGGPAACGPGGFGPWLFISSHHIFASALASRAPLS
jgi:hypothetical protein